MEERACAEHPRRITLFLPRPDDFATLLELVLLEKPVLVVGARRAPSFFLDVLKTLLFPLSWMLPSIDRLPIRVASDLLSGVVPVLAAVSAHAPAAPAREGAVPGGVDLSVVVVDVERRLLDVGAYGDAPRLPKDARDAFTDRVARVRRRETVIQHIPST